MAENSSQYRAICFDLDGTLLPMDIDEFMTEYFTRIAKYAAKNGLDSELFIKALKSGTKAMAMSNDDRLNKDVFWEKFVEVYGPDNLVQAGFKEDGSDVKSMANEFYTTDFVHIGDGFEGNPLAGKTIDVLAKKGYPLLLTTMPMFPLEAVRQRLRWAGVDPGVFARITSYENSKTTKPRQTYFAENLAAMGLRGEDVLMVGNNTMEDFAFLDLGADGYLVTDFLLDPINFDISSVKHGTFKEFAEWADSLPDCANPVEDVSNGPISLEAMETAYMNNTVRDITLDEIENNARKLANAIENDQLLGK